jgi:cytochrome c oxidase subunit 2
LWVRLVVSGPGFLALPALVLIAAACQPGSGAPAGPGDVERGRQAFQARGCVGCHTLSGFPGAVGTNGPSLNGIGTTAASRKPNTTAEAYIRESIENPNAFIAPGSSWPAAMPPGLATGQDLNDLVAFLLAQR